MSDRMMASRKVRTRRHGIVVRITHWVNVLCMTVLLMSGLQIFNAHPALYWGTQSNFDHPILRLGSEETPDGSVKGVTTIAGHSADSTGVLGASKVNGEMTARGFPSWITLPSYQDLADGRRWHFFFAWLFVLNGAVYLLSLIVSGHWRGMIPSGAQLRHIGGSIRDHMRLRFPKGEEARTYNVLQRLTYLVLILVVIPVLVLGGLTMSPGLDSVFSGLLDLFGGRQSARTVHFLMAFALLLFTLVHVVMVLLSGFLNNMRSMITGTYVIEEEGRSDG
ncbi:Thiosulfate reductase cytochrome b subunit [Faunimonas pinastri]|uniref:Thiosulfate reductase cytochrome b subunit n=1 Tax=Faunimonas pinastri TaxID=1855383 RepID=A0A1H9AV68_9HYPH|nr:cytochrome b/b6 domain-containing protein [Faunimonas pinastri]SEP80391.1 Thiosulfate reductase cytochrome b subunit [Faunimonas pinastri]